MQCSWHLGLGILHWYQSVDPPSQWGLVHACRAITPTSASAVISHNVDDLTLQQSDDTSGGSHMLAPRPDELPMMTVTHLTSMIAMTHEDISGI
jgi:hypothetical protein